MEGQNAKEAGVTFGAIPFSAESGFDLLNSGLVFVKSETSNFPSEVRVKHISGLIEKWLLHNILRRINLGSHSDRKKYVHRGCHGLLIMLE